MLATPLRAPKIPRSRRQHLPMFHVEQTERLLAPGGLEQRSIYVFDEHWGKSSSTFSWSLEGGWYKEALRTLMYVGNERTLKMMHGPGF